MKYRIKKFGNSAFQTEKYQQVPKTHIFKLEYHCYQKFPTIYFKEKNNQDKFRPT